MPKGHYQRNVRPWRERFWALVVQQEGCWEWLGNKDSNGYGRFWRNGQLYRAHRIAYELLVGPIPEGYEIDHVCGRAGCMNPDHMEPLTKAEHAGRSSAKRDYSKPVTRKKKTHCERGHPYDEDNTILGRGGRRRCRICANAYRRAYCERQRRAAGIPIGPRKGEVNNKAKLTSASVMEIRRRYAGGDTIDVLALDFKVDRSNIWCIVSRKTWKHVE